VGIRGRSGRGAPAAPCGVVLAVLLTDHSGPGSTPLIIVGVVIAYLTTQFLPELPSREGVVAK